MTKITKKDKQLLCLLSRNSRENFTALGKKIGMAKQNVSYRIKRLVKLGVIRKFDLSLNQFLIGCHTFILFIKFQYLTKKKEDEIAAFLREQKSLTYAIRTSGNWDLFLTYITSSVPSMNNMILKLSENYGEFIQKKEFLLVNENYSFPLRYLAPSSDDDCKLSKEMAHQILLTENERKLCAELKKEADCSLVQLSKRTGINYKTICKIIKKLEGQNYILRFGVQLDEKQMGYQDIYCLMRFDNFSAEQCAKLARLAQKMPSIVFMVTTIGPWNVILNFIVQKDGDAIGDIITIREAFSKLIKDYELIKVEYTIKHA